jgi:hypothetical protein
MKIARYIALYFNFKNCNIFKDTAFISAYKKRIYWQDIVMIDEECTYKKKWYVIDHGRIQLLKYCQKINCLYVKKKNNSNNYHKKMKDYHVDDVY